MVCVVRYPVNKATTKDPIVNQINLIHILSHFLMIHFNIILPFTSRSLDLQPQRMSKGLPTITPGFLLVFYLSISSGILPSVGHGHFQVFIKSNFAFIIIFSLHTDDIYAHTHTQTHTHKLCKPR